MKSFLLSFLYAALYGASCCGVMAVALATGAANTTYGVFAILGGIYGIVVGLMFGIFGCSFLGDMRVRYPRMRCTLGRSWLWWAIPLQPGPTCLAWPDLERVPLL